MPTGRAAASGGQRWVQKGAAEEAAAAAAAKKAEKAAAKEKEATPTSPILLAPPVTPKIDRSRLLRIRKLVEDDAGADAQEALEKYSFADRADQEKLSRPRGPRQAARTKSDSFSGMVEAAASPTAAQADMNQYVAYWQNMMNQYYEDMSLQSAQMAGYTTVMLRNIPNRYSREELANKMGEAGFTGQFDFVYLPIDFTSKCNVGYAFINFRDAAKAVNFYKHFNGAQVRKVLSGYTSNKICQVAWAKVQGREQNLANLKTEKFFEKLKDNPEWQPAFYDEKGELEDFQKVLKEGPDKKKVSRAKSGGLTPMGGAMSPSFMMGGYPMTPSFFPGAAAPPPPAKAKAAAPKEKTAKPTLSQKGVAMDSVLSVKTGSDGLLETMVMLKYLPQQWTRANLIDFLNKSYKGQYDFLFLPASIKGEVEDNRGFFFINFFDANHAKAFKDAFNDKKVSQAFGVELKESEDKTCEVQFAELKKVEKSVAKTQSGPQKGKEKDNAEALKAWLPALLDKDGAVKDLPAINYEEETGPKAPGPLKPVPAKAVDVTSLEQSMDPQATPSTPSSKAKAKAKTKAKASQSTASPTPYVQQQQTQMAAMYQYQAMMSQAAWSHMMAQQQAYASRAMGSYGFATSSAPDGSPESIKAQVEYYFSENNLARDAYLRSQWDAEGWMKLEALNKFKKMQAMQVSVDQIADALKASETLELGSGTKSIRLKDEQARTKFAPPKPQESNASS